MLSLSAALHFGCSAAARLGVHHSVFVRAQININIYYLPLQLTASLNIFFYFAEEKHKQINRHRQIPKMALAASIAMAGPIISGLANILASKANFKVTPNIYSKHS